MMIAQSITKRSTRYSTCLLGLLTVVLIEGCTFQSYSPKPIDPGTMAEAFEQRSLDDPQFAAFLSAQSGQTVNLPIDAWDLATLTYTSHYFHPDLNIARAKWNLAQTKTLASKQKALPTLNGSIARSNRANGDINPFAYGFGIDLPIITHGKQQINIDGFEHLSSIAKLNIAQTAWQLRQQVASTLIAFQDNALQLEVAKSDIALNEAIVNMLHKRLQYGEASSLEVSSAKHKLQLSEAQLQSLSQKAAPLKAQLANNLGLPLTAVQTMQLSFGGLATSHTEYSAFDARASQRSALLNRLDVRVGLAEYAIAENALKLVIAKQYPDISISPGIGYEFGDTVWSLGFSGLLTLINKNKAGIAEAEAARALSAAQFEQLQANVIAETNIAHAQYVEATHQLQAHKLQLNQTNAAFDKVSRQFDAGVIDRLTLTLAKIDALSAEKRLISSIKQVNLAKLNLENSLQKPLLTEQPHEK